MAKIRCVCGEVLHDSSDFLSYKGYLVADQDYEDVAVAMEHSGRSSAFRQTSKTFFQCHSCARLILDLPGGLHFFSADDPTKSQKVLRSVHGEKWKRHLRARWDKGAGEIWWGFGVEDEGFESGIGSWDELKARYQTVFERLRSQELLRDSFLKRDGEYEHKWP